MSEDFLRAYTEYGCSVTDAPIEFHNFVGLVVLATALGKNISFEYSDFVIYPNLWVILLAPSSAFRKTTALRIGKRLLSQVCKDTLLPNEFSQEKLLEIMDRQPQGVFVYYEFMSLAGLLQRDYMAGTKAFLTEIFDCPKRYTRKTKQVSVEIDDPVINMMAATTTEWYLEKAKEGDMYGGFLPRFLYVPVSIKLKTISFPKPPDGTGRNKLATLLNEIRTTVKGAIEFSEEAHHHYDKWYRKFEVTGGKTNSMSGFQSRLTIYCLKIACLYEISATRSRIVSIESMEKACKTINWLSRQLQILAEEFTFTRFASDKKKLLKIIKETPGITRAKLMQNAHLSAKNLNEILGTLIEEERLETEFVKKNGVKKSARCYRLINTE